jgi:hypothetical protein
MCHMLPGQGGYLSASDPNLSRAFPEFNIETPLV